MKKYLLVLVSLCLFLTACGKAESYVETQTEEVPASYGRAIELAKESFESQFADFEDLKITETATAVRPDDESRVVIQFSYQSKNGSGSYGFEYEESESGEPKLIQQGEEVSVYNLSE